MLRNISFICIIREDHQVCIQNVIGKRKGKYYFGDKRMVWNIIFKLTLKWGVYVENIYATQNRDRSRGLGNTKMNPCFKRRAEVLATWVTFRLCMLHEISYKTLLASWTQKLNSAYLYRYTQVDIANTYKDFSRDVLGWSSINSCAWLPVFRKNMLNLRRMQNVTLNRCQSLIRTNGVAAK
jgi:hypothetical protein